MMESERNLENNSNANQNVGGNTENVRKYRPFRIPVKVGEEYDVKIETISKRGDAGVAKIEGMVIFVANTNVGDEIKIRINRVGMGYAIADVVGKGEATTTTTTTDSIETA